MFDKHQLPALKMWEYVNDTAKESRVLLYIENVHNPISPYLTEYIN